MPNKYNPDYNNHWKSTSEVEAYAYCPRSWHYKKKLHKYETEQTKQGVKHHDKLGEKQTDIENTKNEERINFNWSMRLLIVVGAALLLVMEILYLPATLPQRLIIISTTLIILMGSVGLFTLYTWQHGQVAKKYKESGLIPGNLKATDLGKDHLLLEDPEWGIRGSPDYIIASTDGNQVPVEAKSGRTPKKPHYSHKMQMACHLRLIEKTTGTAPVYGILQYPDGLFRINWTEKLQKQLAELLEEIEHSIRLDNANRNHKNYYKCQSCIYYKQCTQRIEEPPNRKK